jgi:uncharacterized protein (DUF488 family)
VGGAVQDEQVERKHGDENATKAVVAGRTVGVVEGRIYSVGYEGLTVAGLVERLQQSRVEELVDVRANPSSRRPGFSRKKLSESLTDAGIAYRHEPLLGNAFRDVEDFAAAMDLMREHLAAGEPAEAVERLIQRADGRRIAVLCLENDQNRCHRQVVLEAALAREPGLEVLQLY